MPKRRPKVKLSKMQILENHLNREMAKREAAIASLVKTASIIPILERQLRLARKRQTQLLMAHTEDLLRTKPTEVVERETVEIEIPAAPEAPADDIPNWLDRTKSDAEAAAEIRAEQEAERKRKSERSRERSQIKQEIKTAELTGKRRKMPLSGKAALDAIRG